MHDFPGMIPELACNPVYRQLAHPICIEGCIRDVALCGRALPIGFRVKLGKHLEMILVDGSVEICEHCLNSVTDERGITVRRIP